jgi:hypothetical protein
MRNNLSKDTLAIDRYDGVFARIVRKYVREGFIDQRDVLILSPTLGLIRANESIPPSVQSAGTSEDWHQPRVNPTRLEELNQKALQLVRDVAKAVNYSEAFVNVGKNLYPLIAGIDNILLCEIVHAKGRGIGPKLVNMKAWILYE